MTLFADMASKHAELPFIRCQLSIPLIWSAESTHATADVSDSLCSDITSIIATILSDIRYLALMNGSTKCVFSFPTKGETFTFDL